MNTSLRKALFLVSLVSFSVLDLHAQVSEELPRHAYWGASFGIPSFTRAGAPVLSITTGTFAEQIGLQPGDIILKVNGTLIDTPSTKEEIFNTNSFIKGGSRVTLDIIRKGILIHKKGTVPVRPKENFKNIITEYRSVLSPYGYKIQVIVTRPEGIRNKIPGIFFVRWMSCDPIEKPVSRKHGVAQMLEDFVLKSGFAVMRVEKPGLGDSEGLPCYDADFNQELAAHQAAYKAFKKLDFIDTTKIIVFAQSNGMAYAPAVPDWQPAAFIVSGGWAKTWFEHMIEFKRRSYELNGDNTWEINRKMNLVTELYTDYLITKKNPGEIVKTKKHLIEVWDGEYNHQWGLPVSYMQQLQDFNVAQAWQKVNVPTYIFYGEYDFAMVEQDHKQVATWVNTNGKDLAHYEFVPKMHHSLFWFENENDAKNYFYEKGIYKEELANRLMEWMKTILQ